MQIIPGPTGMVIATQLAELLDLPLLIPEYKSFPDGESHLRIKGNIESDVLVVQSCYAPQDTHLFQLLNLVSTVKRLGCSHVTVYCPYLCYARADRDVLGGESISIATVLDLLACVGVDHLITLDLHNPEVLEIAQFPTTNIFPVKGFSSYLKEELSTTDNLQIIAPDNGAVERARRLADELDVAYTNLNKIRDPDDGSISIEIGEANISSQNLVIVDDIISTGSTLANASTLLKIHGAEKIHFLISHALGAEAIDRLKEIGNGLVIATNSIPNLMGIVSSAPDIASVLNELGN